MPKQIICNNTAINRKREKVEMKERIDIPEAAKITIATKRSKDNITFESY